LPTLEINGSLLFYEEQGTGLPLIFIHPPLLTHLTFQRQMEHLSHNYRVICFDIRGHGRSSASERPITYPLVVQDVLHLIDHLRLKKVILCGYSTGGSIVLEAMITVPERFAGGIIISGMSEISDFFVRNQIKVAIALMKIKMMSVLAARTVFTNSDTLNLFGKHFKDCMRGNAQNIEQYYRYSLDYNCTDQLHHIKAPILVVYGSRDKIFQRYATILHDKLHDNMMKMIQDADHRIPIKKTVDLHYIIKGWIADMETKDPEEDWGRFYWNHLVEDDLNSLQE
jgi:pimeloyl-ACP methyl ester carboxylesterase